MHVVALIRADPDIIGHGIVGEIGCQLAEVDDIRHSRGIGLHVFVGYERIVLALVELVSAGVVERRLAQRIRLHVRLPGLPSRFELVDDIGHVDGDVVVINHAVERA